MRNTWDSLSWLVASIGVGILTAPGISGQDFTTNNLSLINSTRGGDIGCEFDTQCSDGAACTLDVCLQGICFHTAAGDIGCEGDFCPIGVCDPSENVCQCDDCNSNGVPDNEDIGMGSSMDVDENGVPDECCPDVCFIGACEAPEPTPLNRWSCPGNWNLGGTIFPDAVLNPDVYEVTLGVNGGPNDVFLDVTVSIESLALINGATLRVTSTTDVGDMNITGGGALFNAAKILVAKDRIISAPSGTTVIAEAGSYQADPDASGLVSAQLLTAELVIREGSITRSGGAGTVALKGDMTVASTGSTTLDGTGAVSCGDAKGNCRPPVLGASDSSNLEVGDDLVFIQSVDFRYESTEPVTVGGDFENGSRYPECFTCSGMTFGSTTRTRGTLHRLEVAGVDFGPKAAGFRNNFAMGTLEVAEGHTLELQNLIRNTVDASPCSEALYVDQLILNPNATIVLNNCRLYARTVVNLGGRAVSLGCGGLVDYDASDTRGGITLKGSLLIFPDVAVTYKTIQGPNGPTYELAHDTVLTLINDQPEDVQVQLYFVQGDPPTEIQMVGDPPVVLERAHEGWNWVGCQTNLTGNQPLYWSAATGLPLGCQPFSMLDAGEPIGRPSPDGRADLRVIRGFVAAWAVDARGREIAWNHLSGSAASISYEHSAVSEYNAWATQTISAELGDPSDGVPGRITLDGIEYGVAPSSLIFDFYTDGVSAFSTGPGLIESATELTLVPLTFDLRQDANGPTTTQAKFDVWNENEIRFSGTTRCVNCWDQTLLSRFDAPNNFLPRILHTRKGRARIDGVASIQCPNSTKAPLLGVAVKRLQFDVLERAHTFAHSAISLPGQGVQEATIRYDSGSGGSDDLQRTVAGRRK